jgi:hypothetical protein
MSRKAKTTQAMILKTNFKAQETTEWLTADRALCVQFLNEIFEILSDQEGPCLVESLGAGDKMRGVRIGEHELTEYRLIELS